MVDVMTCIQTNAVLVWTGNQVLPTYRANVTVLKTGWWHCITELASINDRAYCDEVIRWGRDLILTFEDERILCFRNNLLADSRTGTKNPVQEILEHDLLGVRTFVSRSIKQLNILFVHQVEHSP